jgi:hypothetical protein
LPKGGDRPAVIPRAVKTYAQLIELHEGPREMSDADDDDDDGDDDDDDDDDDYDDDDDDDDEQVPNDDLNV